MRAVVSSSGFEETSPQSLGVDIPDGQILGVYALPDDLPHAEYLTKKRELMTLYDTLLPSFAASHSPDATAAKEVMSVFSRISEPPLQPFYESLGAEWFEWVV